MDNPAEDDLEDEQEFVLEPEEKYKMARDSLNELRELLCCHGTQQYLEYLWELDKVKTKARRGLSLLTSKKMQLAPESEEEKVEEKAELEEENEYAEGRSNKGRDDQVKEKRAKY